MAQVPGIVKIILERNCRWPTSEASAEPLGIPRVALNMSAALPAGPVDLHPRKIDSISDDLKRS